MDDQVKVQPITAAGTVTLAGEKVQIGAGTVSFKEGVSSERLVKKLKEASEKDLFPIPALVAHE